MKTERIIQISLIIITALILLVKGPSNFKEPKEAWALNKGAAGVILGQPRYYQHSSRVYFRVSTGPRRGYYYYNRPYYYNNYPYRRYSTRSEVFLTVREDPNSKERISDVFIDNYRVNLSPPSERGYRGNFRYRLQPGDHTIEWTVKKSLGRKSQYQRQFYVDGSGRSINLNIDGNEFYRN